MRRMATPLLVSPSGMTAQPLSRRPVRSREVSGYDELWVQQLIHRSPSVLPISEVEPAFWPLVPVCMELPLASGYLDNFLVTPTGDLVAVECKLWRNIEARREVVAQVIDYAKALQSLSYDELEGAIGSARRESRFKLYEHVSSHSGEPEPSMDEAGFIDAVSRNLRRGRCLLVVAGDGITEGVEGLTEFLQQHAGLQFALVLVQLAVHDLPDGAGAIVVPSVPLRTTNIVRGIVQIHDSQPVVGPPVAAPQSKAATTLSAEDVFASLDGMVPGTSEQLVNFITSLQDLQVQWDVKKGITVRMIVGDQRVSFLWIGPGGDVDTRYAYNAKHLTKEFSEALAAAVPGGSLRETPTSYYVMGADGGSPSVWSILEHKEAVRAAIMLLNKAMVVAESD